MSNDTQPEIRFPGFTDDWEQRKFGVTNSYFTDGNYGESYPSADELSDKLNGVPFLRGSNLKNGRLVEEDANYITPEKHAELTSGHLELDDIVVAVRGSLGALGYAGQENVGWNINSQLAIIRTDKSELKGQFLIQYLLSSKGQKELLSRNTGTALKQLPIKQLKDVPVPIPGIDEQDRIGSFFVNLDTTIALHQRKLDLLKETKKGFLQKMFPKNGAKVPEIRFPGFTGDWEDREFSEIVKTTGYNAYLSEAFEVGEYPVIQQGDKPILGYSDKKPFENFEDVVLFGDHTLSLYKPETPFLVATDGLKIITVPNFSGSFLLSLLEKYVPESQGYKRHFTILKKEQVAFPTDVKERVLIGEFFTQIDRTITLHQRKLDLLKETKKGFLQKMFV